MFYDTLIIGAGLSGIGAACRLKTAFPNDSFTIIESREAIGGTWDLFRYPGIRSDSDMLTLGYEFRPWVGDKFLADGPSIKKYIETVAEEYGVTAHIQFGSKVAALEFSSKTDIWTVTINNAKSGEVRRLQARFIMSAAGYYNYAEGHTPDFEGREDFKGDIIHPQHWPEDFDYAGKEIVVVGSGATAVTLIPQLAGTAKNVTMLQRSPSYVASIPSRDRLGSFINAILPDKLGFKVNRAKNIAIARFMYKRAKKNPEKTKAWFREKTLRALGPDYPVDTHFKPRYNPWEQRVCMIPDEDMFIAIREGRASVQTDEIARFTPRGLELVSGKTLEADVIITATGLNVVFNGQAQIFVDGHLAKPSDSYGYKGMMYSGVPNLISVFGYTNASWTLRADLMSQFAVRLRKHMKEHAFSRALPRAPENMPRHPWIDFQAGYLQRVMHELPSQGDVHPWRNEQDYKLDKKLILEDPIDDGALVFSRSDAQQMAAE